MSPDMKLDFENAWDDLHRRLRGFLFRKKVPSARHDDLVQETALRLLVMWDQVDRKRSLWPLTVTIVTNLIRDEGRTRPIREVAGDLPEEAAKVDVERSGLARVELERVRAAMAGLTAPQRAALLQEIGAATGNGHSANAEKMLRLRARRKLSSMIRDVSGFALLRYRRAVEILQGLLPSYEGLLPTTTCVICVLMGLSGGMMLETSTGAEARQIRSERWMHERDLAMTEGTAATSAGGIDAATTARPTIAAHEDADAVRTRPRAARPQVGVTSPTLLPDGGDAPIPIPRTPPVPQPGYQPGEVNPEAEIPEHPEPPSQDDAPVQLPVELPDAVTDPLDAGAGL